MDFRVGERVVGEPTASRCNDISFNIPDSANSTVAAAESGILSLIVFPGQVSNRFPAANNH